MTSFPRKCSNRAGDRSEFGGGHGGILGTRVNEMSTKVSSKLLIKMIKKIFCVCVLIKQELLQGFKVISLHMNSHYPV